VTEDERSTAALLARLRGEIAADRALVERCVHDAALARARLADGSSDPGALALAAVALHGWYTGVETIVERVARLIDRELPEGDRWHRELLAQALVDVPGVRPAILPGELAGALADLLSFRHFFRHAYGVVLDRTRIEPLLTTLAAVEPAVRGALDRFDVFLEATALR
jgi:hypothetical protein